MQTYSNDLSWLCKKPSNTVHDNLTISESILFATCLKRIPEPLGTAAFFHSSIFKSELIPGTLYILPQQRSWSIRLVKGFAFSSHPRCTPGPLNQKKTVASSLGKLQLFTVSCHKGSTFEAWDLRFLDFSFALWISRDPFLYKLLVFFYFFQYRKIIFQMFPHAVHVIISTHLQHSACG